MTALASGAKARRSLCHHGDVTVKVRGLLYSIYERRLLSIRWTRPPRHVAVMCDGNRRWARENGFTDVSHGHRMGALKISELLEWCDAAGIEMATIYLLSTENLRRDPEELDTLLEIITDVVEEISGPSKNWSVQIVGALDLLPAEQSRRLRDAADGTEGRTGTHVNIAIGYGGRQEIADAVQSLLSDEDQPRTQWRRTGPGRSPSTVSTVTSTRRVSPIPTW